jgi:hypothetical protein
MSAPHKVVRCKIDEAQATLNFHHDRWVAWRIDMVGAPGLEEYVFFFMETEALDQTSRIMAPRVRVPGRNLS